MPARKVIKRNPETTRESILQAGLTEFGAQGYGGARIEQIARRAGCNIRMIYHYFGGKQKLYVACLERVYSEIREKEQQLDLSAMDPAQGITALVEFTFDHMASHRDFVEIAVAENMQHGRYLQKSELLQDTAAPLINTIRTLLNRGRKSGAFRADVDPVQFYISILSLSYLHISNRHTLSITYKTDLTDPSWLADRRKHVLTFVMGYLRGDAN